MGTGILLLVIGAILAFAIKARLSWIDLNAAGVVLILAGLTVLGLTLYFWRQRRKRHEVSIVEEARLSHHRGGVPPDPPDVDSTNPPDLP